MIVHFESTIRGGLPVEVEASIERPEGPHVGPWVDQLLVFFPARGRGRRHLVCHRLISERDEAILADEAVDRYHEER